MKIHTLSLSLLLVMFWLLNSGLFKPLIFMMGGASVVLVLYIAARMNVIDEESQPLHLTKSIPAYYLWLLKELVVSNVQVVATIWKGGQQRYGQGDLCQFHFPDTWHGHHGGD
jgi:multicomponent Na+:H+ antiporter subunit E